MTWRLDREPRPPSFVFGLGILVGHNVVSVLVLFWRISWLREPSPSEWSEPPTP